MTRIFWDSNLFIYLLEAHPVFTSPTKELLARIRRAHLNLSTSVITSAELQTGPLRKGNVTLAKQYKERLKRTATLIPFGEEEADRYAELRRTVSVRGADAVQLASASVAGTELFVTNDLRLHKYRVQGIHFIVSIETALQLIQ